MTHSTTIAAWLWLWLWPHGNLLHWQLLAPAALAVAVTLLATPPQAPLAWLRTQWMAVAAPSPPCCPASHPFDTSLDPLSQSRATPLALLIITLWRLAVTVLILLLLLLLCCPAVPTVA
jgi:hypothetical protein